MLITEKEKLLVFRQEGKRYGRSDGWPYWMEKNITPLRSIGRRGQCRYVKQAIGKMASQIRLCPYEPSAVKL